MRILVVKILKILIRVTDSLPVRRKMKTSLYYFFYNLYAPVLGVVLAEVQGSKMFLDLSDNGIPKFLFVYGVWENFQTEVFKRCVKDGMVVLDVGAHAGYYALIASNLVGNKGKVFAFEPDPENFACLVKNIEINRCSNVIPVKKAVSNRNGTTKLFLVSENKGGHTIYEKVFDLLPRERRNKSIEVDVTTLDQFFKGSYKVDLIKMDIEGAEIAAFQGMTNILKKNEHMIVMLELHPEALKTCGFSPKDFLDELMKHGFKIFIISEENQTLNPIHVTSVMEICSRNCFYNLLCLK